MQPLRVFLRVSPVQPKGAPRPPLRYKASWVTRGASTDFYTSQTVASEEEAVRLARKWLDQRNREYGVRPQLIDTTDQPERFGYSHPKKSAEELDAEIAAALTKRTP